jgi:hypothetical protein
MNFKNLIKNVNGGFFIQIGSYDGVSNDDFGLRDKIINERHTSIFVEPIVEYYDKLVNNYKQSNSDVFFENIAISDKKEIKKIQINGQDTSFVRKFDDIVEELVDVRCEPFKYLIDKYNIEKIDAIVIDTEAYELVVIESIFSNDVQIDIIRYEFVHLSVEDSEKIVNILISKGYDIYQDENSYADKIAIKNKIK